MSLTQPSYFQRFIIIIMMRNSLFTANLTRFLDKLPGP
ncbi:putative DNA polymerase III [Salmonella phage 40]|nr:putative DNA polymerase III [Salmonella phage 40]